MLKTNGFKAEFEENGDFRICQGGYNEITITAPEASILATFILKHESAPMELAEPLSELDEVERLR